MKSLKDRNDFSCYLYWRTEKGAYDMNSNNACWAGIRYYYDSKDGGYYSDKKQDVEFIYIKDFERVETLPYLDLLISIINEITPCEIMEANKTKYIKFKLLKTYNQSLVLLNFIRNLWYCPKPYYGKTEPGFGYTVTFFETLKASKKEDPLERLTEANNAACKEIKSSSSFGHSNVHPYGSLKVKKTKDLLAFKGNGCLSQLLCKS